MLGSLWECRSGRRGGDRGEGQERSPAAVLWEECNALPSNRHRTDSSVEAYLAGPVDD